MINNYQNSKIYKIIPIGYYERDDIPESDQYIGSTKNRLIKRLISHQKKFKYEKEKYLSSFDLFDKYGADNCKIELIEDYPCNTNKELRKREDYHIKKHYCVNKNNAYIENKKEYRKEYNINYQDIYKSTKYYCKICDCTVIRAKKERHKRSNKHLNNL
jgi:hypothetical protein